MRHPHQRVGTGHLVAFGRVEVASCERAVAVTELGQRRGHRGGEGEVTAPAPDDYTIVVHGYETDGPDANCTLFAWAVPEANLGNFTVSGPPAAGGTVTCTWSGLAPGLRCLVSSATRMRVSR